MANRLPSQMQEGCRGRAGFTIVEVVVAIVLLSITVMSLSSFTFYTARQVHRSKMTSLATILAREVVDEARAAKFDDLKVGSSVDSVSIGVVSLYATTVVGYATDDLGAPMDNLKFVKVSVAELSGGELQRFETYIHRGVGQ